MKNQLLLVFCILFLLLLLATRGTQLYSALGLNLANLAIYRSFSEEQTDATSRQKALASATAWLPEDTGGTQETAAELPMIQASLRGLYYHRLRDWHNAAAWYGSAANGKPIPEQQNQLLISPWMTLDPSGDFELQGTADVWHLRGDAPYGAAIKKTDSGTLQISCSEITADTKKVAMEWSQEFDIPYHHTLVLKAKSEIGTTLNFETVIDRQLVRHLTHKGTGKWEDFTIPVEGDHVKYIYVIVREDLESTARSCLAEIDGITFLLDPWIEDDSSG